MAKRSADALADGGAEIYPIATREVKGDVANAFGQWLLDNRMLSNYVSSQNPAQAPGLWGEGNSILYRTMFDHYRENPEILKTHVIQYLRDIDSWILKKLPPQVTDSDTIVWTEFKLRSGPMPNAARGTLAPQLAVTRESQSMKLTYYAEGFATDMYTADKPESIELFAAHMRQVVSDFLQSMAFDVCAKLHTAVFAYCDPLKRMTELPNSLDDADRIKRETYCEVTKGSLGLLHMIVRHAQMMGNHDNTAIESVIMSQNLYAIVKSDFFRKFTMIEGANAIRNRTRMTDPIDIDINLIPALSRTRNNEMEARLLSSRVQTGSIGTHVNARIGAPLGDWKTHFTDFSMASWDSNGFVKYRKRDTIQHSLLFQACDYIKESTDVNFQPTYQGKGKEKESEKKSEMGGQEPEEKESELGEPGPGELNYTLINEMISKFSSICADSRTSASDFNKKRFNPFVRFDGNDMYPVMFPIEMHEHYIQFEHIHNGFKTAGAALFKRMDSEDIAEFKGNAVDDGLLNKFIFRVKECMPWHPLLKDIKFVRRFLDAVKAKTPINNVLDAMKTVLMEKDAGFDKRLVLHAKEHIDKLKTDPYIARMWRHLLRQDFVTMIGGAFYLFNPISLHSLVRQCDVDIDIVIGAKVVRPFEEQWVEAVASTAEGRIGTLYHNKPIDSVMVDGTRKLAQVTREMRFGAAYQRKEGVVIENHVAGSDVVGGSGNDWFVDLSERPRNLFTIDDNYFQTINEALFEPSRMKRPNPFNQTNTHTGCFRGYGPRNHTNFAVITGMSECIGTDSHSGRMDLCGYPNLLDYIGILHYHEDLTNKEQGEFQSDGTAWGQFVHRFSHEKRQRLAGHGDFSYDSYNFATMAEITRANTLCYPTTIIVTDADGNLKELTGCHLRGRQGEGCYHLDSGGQRYGVVDM